MKMRHVYPWKNGFAHDGSKIQCKKCKHHNGQQLFCEPSGVVFLGYRVNFTVFDGSYTIGASQWANHTAAEHGRRLVEIAQQNCLTPPSFETKTKKNMKKSKHFDDQFFFNGVCFA